MKLKEPIEIIDYWNDFIETVINEYTLVILREFPDIVLESYKVLAQCALIPYLYFDNTLMYRKYLFVYLKTLKQINNQIINEYLLVS